MSKGAVLRVLRGETRPPIRPTFLDISGVAERNPELLPEMLAKAEGHLWRSRSLGDRHHHEEQVRRIKREMIKRGMLEDESDTASTS